MRLFLTRDAGDKEVGLLWVADEPPMCGGGVYTHMGPCKSISRVMVPGDPGTCTELYTEREVQQMLATSGEFLTLAHAIEQSKLFTEREVRERVAKAILGVDIRRWTMVWAIANAVSSDPSDEVWARLMAEVGAGGEA